MKRSLSTLAAGIAVGSALTLVAPRLLPMPARAAGDGCTRGAYLVVAIDNLDRTKSKAYGDALRQSQIVARHGGAYKISGAPAEVLEGQWPQGRSMVVERYPCLDAIRQFWYSDEYQKQIKPLRAGSGDYLVAAFEEFQSPAAR
jgi:uncharacterized protein (DUF1330 family)